MLSNATFTGAAVPSLSPDQTYARSAAVAMLIFYLPLLALAKNHLLYHYKYIKSASARTFARTVLYTHVAVSFAEVVRWHARAYATPTSLPVPDIVDMLLLTLQMSSSIWLTKGYAQGSPYLTRKSKPIQ